MKLYVDEFPKSCWDCPCHKGDNGLCKLLQEYTDYVPKSCPLQSLADYTKQVRKEVKEEIAKNVSVVCINGVKYASYSDLEKILYDEKELPKWETLNKEGE